MQILCQFFWQQICLVIFQRLTARSPEMLAPARMPVAAGKKIAKTEKKVSPLKSGSKFSTRIPAEKGNRKMWEEKSFIMSIMSI